MMSASIQSNVQRIELVTEYDLDGERDRSVQSLHIIFLEAKTAAVVCSSGILEDFRLLLGDRIVVSPLGNNHFELVGVEHPSPMRHFESTASSSGPFPMDELHRIGGEVERGPIFWTTHIPAAEFAGFCERSGLVFPESTEVFSGLSSVLL